MKYEKDWREIWVDRMGLIVALSGAERFDSLNKMKKDMAENLNPDQINIVKDVIRQRFTPTNGENGCQSATQAVKEIV